jgi:hypothetical protein
MLTLGIDDSPMRTYLRKSLYLLMETTRNPCLVHSHSSTSGARNWKEHLEPSVASSLYLLYQFFPFSDQEFCAPRYCFRHQGVNSIHGTTHSVRGPVQLRPGTTNGPLHHLLRRRLFSSASPEPGRGKAAERAAAARTGRRRGVERIEIDPVGFLEMLEGNSKGQTMKSELVY